jgi:hypothetical protein
MALFLVVMGGIASLVGWVWIMINAFSESVPWGVGSLFCGLVALVYGILHWDELKIPVLLMAVGTIVGIIGRVIGGM